MKKNIPAFEMTAVIESVKNRVSKTGSPYTTIQVMDIGVNFESFIGSELVENVVNGERHKIIFAPVMNGRNIGIGNIISIEHIGE